MKLVIAALLMVNSAHALDFVCDRSSPTYADCLKGAREQRAYDAAMEAYYLGRGPKPWHCDTFDRDYNQCAARRAANAAEWARR